METVESALRSSVDGSETRVADLENAAQKLQAKLETAENASKTLDIRLGQALRGGESARKELAEKTNAHQVRGRPSPRTGGAVFVGSCASAAETLVLG